MTIPISHSPAPRGRTGRRPAALGLALMILFQALPLAAQSKYNSTFAVQAQAPVKDGNFFRARKIAVRRAMAKAVEESLKETLGEVEYFDSRPALKSILKHAPQYVRSYRFLSANDNPAENTAEVDMEITLYSDVLRRRLGAMGLLSGEKEDKAVVILVNERGLSTYDFVPFWDNSPVSEKILIADFKAAGLKTLGRESVRYSLPERTVLNAARGDISAGVDIGHDAGADIVLVGNAVSTVLGAESESGPKTVRVSLSLKAMSALQSRIIAAKSEFATARRATAREAEAEAYRQAGKKLADFFIASIRRFRNPRKALPRAMKPRAAPPNLMEDL